VESHFQAPCWLCFRAFSAQNYTAYDLTLLVLALFLIPAQSIMFGRKLAEAELSQSALLRRYAITLVRGIAIIAYIITLWRLNGRSFRLLGLGAPTNLGSHIGFILDLVLAAFFAIQYLRLGTLSPQQLAKFQEAMKSQKIAPRNSAEFSAFCFLAVIGSTSEELLFRGFLIWFFSPVVGLVGAIACSAIVFGVAHAYQGWRNVVSTALAGAIFAVAYVATGSLWWLIIAHILMNIRGGLLGLRVTTQSPKTYDATA
jgi:membrane protease YdiL (CAAX protease family)